MLKHHCTMRKTLQQVYRRVPMTAKHFGEVILTARMQVNYLHFQMGRCFTYWLMQKIFSVHQLVQKESLGYLCIDGQP